ncbi:MAG: dienelactone hydrolase family protein [Ilumatobacteraceae bacterium]|nr:dienelactone hydrolase family protein [Ilumatobacteraceae bacterium]
MVDVIVFHHALGVTAGVRAFADRLMAAGHRVMVPDLYDGETLDTIEAGVGHAEAIGFDTIIDRGVAVVTATDEPFVTIGFSLGVLPAQSLAQTHRRAVGAVLCHAAIPLGTFADDWPEGVALQLHNAPDDSWGDLDEAQALAAAVPGAELFRYDTARHLVADSSVDDYDADIAEQIIDRTLMLLATVS